MRGGQATTIALSFIASCTLHKLNPYTYLRAVLTRLPADLDDLLPHRWQPG